MRERVVSKLSSVWMATAVISLILPVFLPSYPDSRYQMQNVIGATMITMFALSFPSSLLALPLLLFAQIALGLDPNTISGMYFIVVSFFVIGLAQWFFIVPWVMRTGSDVEILGLSDRTALDPAMTDFCSVPSREKSPVEEFISTDAQ